MLGKYIIQNLYGRECAPLGHPKIKTKRGVKKGGGGGLSGQTLKCGIVPGLN